MAEQLRNGIGAVLKRRGEGRERGRGVAESSHYPQGDRWWSDEVGRRRSTGDHDQEGREMIIERVCLWRT